MPAHWIAAITASIIALAVVWQRRDTIPSPNLGLATKALLTHSAGLLFISPLGEPAGTALYYLTDCWNLEDVIGHALLVTSAFFITARALIMDNRPQRIPSAAYSAQFGIVLIMCAYIVTHAANAPSAVGNPSDSAYWTFAMVFLAPTFAYSAYANITAATYKGLPCYARTMALCQFACMLTGFIACAVRPIPAIPPALTYWGLAVSLLGQTIVCWIVWQRVQLPFRRLRTGVK